MRWVSRVLVFALCASLACEKAPVAPPSTGGLALSIEIEASSSAARLDDGIVHVRGPTDRDVGIAPGETKTITKLNPGPYTVSLEGLSSGEVELFGQTSGVQVVAGQDTPVTVTLGSFVPVLQVPDTSREGGFTVSFGAVAGAASYLVEWDTAAGFATPQSTSITGTSVTIPIAGFGRYFVRVRAVSEFNSRPGRASDPGGPIEILLAFASISAGSSHSCGLTTSGTAYCWGSNRRGEVGDGTTISRLVPTPVAGGLSLPSLSAGGGYTCGVTATGAGYCWGLNFLDDAGTQAPKLLPTLVATALSFAAISPGDEHTCGLTTRGVVYCWGWNEYGQLGEGTVTDRLFPTPVQSGLSFDVVSAGHWGHTCAVRTGGAAYCWGMNDMGQLGDSTGFSRTVPTLVAEGLSYAAVSAGSFHTCGATSGGVAYCWGSNFYGELGDGTTTDRSVPTAVAYGHTFATVSAGQNFTCGVTTSGRAYCWGANRGGQLGDGSTTDRSVPTPVAGGLIFALVDVGPLHTCGVTTSGRAYCWGANRDGELGDGSTTGSFLPTPVEGT